MEILWIYKEHTKKILKYVQLQVGYTPPTSTILLYYKNSIGKGAMSTPLYIMFKNQNAQKWNCKGDIGGEIHAASALKQDRTGSTVTELVRLLGKKAIRAFIKIKKCLLDNYLIDQ
jgi:hypothetical protein